MLDVSIWLCGFKALGFMAAQWELKVNLLQDTLTYIRLMHIQIDEIEWRYYLSEQPQTERQSEQQEQQQYNRKILMRSCPTHCGRRCLACRDLCGRPDLIVMPRNYNFRILILSTEADKSSQNPMRISWALNFVCLSDKLLQSTKRWDTVRFW